MSLYGLDFILDDKKGLRLVEINGVSSGTTGFNEIYGDNRVEEEVLSALRKENDILSVCTEPVIEDIKLQKSLTKKKLKDLKKIQKKLYLSDKAYSDWIDEKPENIKTIVEDGSLRGHLPIYYGQFSLVFNYYNSPNIKHETVNPYHNEEITRNKLFQYLLLEEFYPQTTLVGLGFCDENAFSEMMENHESFVIKPVTGSMGRGVKKLEKEEFLDYRNKAGNIDSLTDVLSIIFPSRKEETLEDHIEQGNFLFEDFVAVVQPEISQSGKNKNSIRAIVCDGRFLDSYMRLSDKVNTNLSQGARPARFQDSCLERYSEEIVSAFEKRCNGLQEEDFREKLYEEYLSRTRRPFESNFILDVLMGESIHSKPF